MTEALTNRRIAALFRVQTAMKPQTRTDRIARFVSMCARGETLHPPKKSGRTARVG